MRRIEKLDDDVSLHQRLMQLIAMNDVPRLKEVLALALKNQWSVHYITSKILHDIDGVYSARPSEKDKSNTVCSS